MQVDGSDPDRFLYQYPSNRGMQNSLYGVVKWIILFTI